MQPTTVHHRSFRAALLHQPNTNKTATNCIWEAKANNMRKFCCQKSPKYVVHSLTCKLNLAAFLCHLLLCAWSSTLRGPNPHFPSLCARRQGICIQNRTQVAVCAGLSSPATALVGPVSHLHVTGSQGEVKALAGGRAGRQTAGLWAAAWLSALEGAVVVLVWVL